MPKPLLDALPPTVREKLLLLPPRKAARLMLLAARNVRQQRAQQQAVRDAQAPRVLVRKSVTTVQRDSNGLLLGFTTEEFDVRQPTE